MNASLMMRLAIGTAAIAINRLLYSRAFGLSVYQMGGIGVNLDLNK